MRFLAVGLMLIGLIVCLGSTGVETSRTIGSDNPLGPLGVISFEGQHVQLMTFLTGGLMLVVGTILLGVVEIRTVLHQMRKDAQER